MHWLYPSCTSPSLPALIQNLRTTAHALVNSSLCCEAAVSPMKETFTHTHQTFDGDLLPEFCKFEGPSTLCRSVRLECDLVCERACLTLCRWRSECLGHGAWLLSAWRCAVLMASLTAMNSACCWKLCCALESCCCSSSAEVTAVAFPLQGIYGVARPHELQGLMGPSGAGKSTLMDLLAMRTDHDGAAAIMPGADDGADCKAANAVGATPSQLLVNGVEVSRKDFMSVSAYVPQVGRVASLLGNRQQGIGTTAGDFWLSAVQLLDCHFAHSSITWCAVIQQ